VTFELRKAYMRPRSAAAFCYTALFSVRHAPVVSGLGRIRRLIERKQLTPRAYHGGSRLLQVLFVLREEENTKVCFAFFEDSSSEMPNPVPS
jgi:hypothetical protein